MTDFAAPAHTRLFAEFASALESGDPRARVSTPAFTRREQPISDVLLDELAGTDGHITLTHLLRAPVAHRTAKDLLAMLGGEDGAAVLRHLVQSMAYEYKSDVIEVHLPAKSAIAALARAHADYHALDAEADDAEADEEFRADYSDAARLAAKDAISEVQA